MAFKTKGEPKRLSHYKADGDVAAGRLVKLTAGGKVAHSGASEAAVGVSLHAAKSGEQVAVADHPDQELVGTISVGNDQVKEDGTGWGSNFKISSANVDSEDSTGATTSPIKVLCKHKRQGNSLAAAGGEVVCVINNHQLNGGTGTAKAV